MPTKNTWNPAEQLEYLKRHMQAWRLVRTMQSEGETKMPPTIDEMILDYGRPFTKRVKLPREIVRRNSKECYFNAWRYWMKMQSDLPGLKYCEGQVAPENCIIPILHGWCVDSGGRIHDPSVGVTRRAVYYGVTFKDEFVNSAWQELRKNERIGILPNVWCMPEIAFNPDTSLEKPS